MRKTEKICVGCEPGWARTCSSCNLVSEEIICDSCGNAAEYCWGEECDYCSECLDEAINFYWGMLKTDEKIKLLKEYYGAEKEHYDAETEITEENVDGLWEDLASSDRMDVIDPHGTEIKEV